LLLLLSLKDNAHLLSHRDRCKKTDGDRCKKTDGDRCKKTDRDRCKKTDRDRCKKAELTEPFDFHNCTGTKFKLICRQYVYDISTQQTQKMKKKTVYLFIIKSYTTYKII